MKPNIDCLSNLTPTQLAQLRSWIETLGYRKTVERASEQFGQPIHKTALQRFIRRAAPAEFLEDTPEKDEATRQILKFAADGQPNFTASTLDALEKLAFQLTLTCTAIDDDMHALVKISTMLCRFRNTASRERTATVQEGKLKLREKQFEKSSGNPNHDAQIENLNKKIAEAFDSHPVLTAIHAAEQAASNPAPTPTPDLNPNLFTETNPRSAIRDPQCPGVPPKNKNLETIATEPNSPSLQSEISNLQLIPPPSVISPTLEASPREAPDSTCHMKPAQCPMKHEKPDIDSLATNERKSKTAEQTQSHTLRRWLSYIPRRPCDPAPDDSWINECPCGEPLPCTAHANLWRELRYTKPWDPDYSAALTRHGIPVYTPSATELNLPPKPLSECSSKTLSNLSTITSRKAPDLNAT